MTTLSKQQLLEAVSGIRGSYELRTNTTLTVIDEDGSMAGYCSDQLLQILTTEMLNEYLGMVNQERIAMLKQLDADAITDLHQVAEACVDPLLNGLAGPYGKIITFCHRAVLFDQIDIDMKYWWTPTLHQTLVRIARSQARPISGRLTRAASVLNFSFYHFIGRNTNLSWLINLPLNDDDRQTARDWLMDITLAIIKPPSPNRPV